MRKTFLHLVTPLIVASLFLSSCSPKPEGTLTPASPSSHETAVTQLYPTMTMPASKTARPTAKITATPRPTRTATPTGTPVGDWQFPVIEIKEWWAKGYALPSWISDSEITVLDDSRTVIIDALSGKPSRLETPTPTPGHFQFRGSAASANYKIDCSQSPLRMVHLPDQRLISQSNLPVSDCVTVKWAPNETAASLVTDNGQLYIWPTNGSEPYFVSDITPYTCAIWSPDSSKMVTVRFLPDAGEATFQIVYPDGRPLQTTNAVIEAGNQWEACSSVTWLTNDVIRNTIACVIGNYCLQDFYDANTGRFLIRNDPSDIGAIWPKDYLSPNERWLALDTYPANDNWEGRDNYGFKRALILYDLKNHHKAIWAETFPPSLNPEVFRNDSGHSFEFVAWNQDSNQFYYLHFPFEQPTPDLPIGYLALDPVTLKSTLLIPNVVMARPSYDQQFIFAVTAETIEAHTAEGLQGAIYTVGGEQVTKPQWIAERMEFDMLNTLYSDPYSFPDLITTSWDGRSEQVVFSDANNRIWVASQERGTNLVASNLPNVSWPERTSFNWSPDAQFLLIQSDKKAWIVKMR